jgi:hypothetical protein
VIYHWVNWVMEMDSPGGTIERSRGATSVVPPGLSILLTFQPSSELLGYSQSSLRDGEITEQERNVHGTVGIWPSAQPYLLLVRESNDLAQIRTLS